MWETSIVLHLFMRALFQILGTVRHCSQFILKMNSPSNFQNTIQVHPIAAL